MYLFIIAVIIIIVLLSSKKCRKTEGITFEAPFLVPYYEKHGIEINPSKKTLTKNGNSVYYGLQFNSVRSRIIANNKLFAKRVLIKNNIPTPKYYHWNSKKSFNKNCTYITKLKFPIVIKPTLGIQGSDVYADIINMKQARPILIKLLKKTNNILIEECIQGNTYRVLVLNDTIIGVYHIQKPEISGDGVHTINYLINQLIEKSKNPLNYLQINYRKIKKQGYNMNDIPLKNKRIIITNVSNNTLYSEPLRIPIKQIHPHNIEMFLKINRVLNLNTSGIDYITHDMSIPYYEYGAVLEANPFPGIKGNHKADPNFVDRFLKSIDFS